MQRLNAPIRAAERSHADRCGLVGRSVVRGQCGFTLIELLLTVAVAGVVLSLAVPSFTNLMRNNARATRVNDMIGAFSIARSEAITRRTTVSLCASKAPFSACNTPIDGSFDLGWIVFQDDNGTRGVVDAGDTVLRVFNPDMDGSAMLTFTHNNDAATVGAVTLNSRGRLETLLSTPRRLRYCDRRGAADSVAVIEVSVSGQARVQNAQEMSTDSDLTRNIRCPS